MRVPPIARAPKADAARFGKNPAFAGEKLNEGVQPLQASLHFASVPTRTPNL